MAARARNSMGYYEEVQSRGDGDIGEDITKAWNLDDAYRYAPKRPDGDPWKVLLDPLLERERIRCDGWKDEVGNLLIFAGLFSAVVTAFLIDSYKTLQPSDNKDIIALLSQIALNQLNNTLNLNAVPDPNLPQQLQLQAIQLPSQTFQPPPSAIRINTLWFLSLILALTVVLVGIVSLQWLRAYQTYDLITLSHQQQQQQPARTALALHHMRSEALRRWHVWKIMNALPVLLQIGLVLFLVGVVDFLKTQVGGGGGKTVWVCVLVAVGGVFLFMLGTTLAPGVQMGVVPMRIWWRRGRGGGGGRDGEGEGGWDWAPSQCPYKSPQASLVCGIVDLVIRACGFVFGFCFGWCVGCLGSSWNVDDDDDDGMGGDAEEKGESIPMGKTRDRDRTNKAKANKRKSVMNTYLSALRRTRSWMEFDLMWLRIRDAYVQSVYVGRFGRLGLGCLGGLDGEERDGEGERDGEEPMGVDLGIEVPLYDTLALLKGFTRKTKKYNSNSNAKADAGGTSQTQSQTQTQTLSTEVLVAAYHCLAEISRGLTVDRLTPGKDLKGEVEVVKERSGYLRFSCDVGFETLEFASGPTSPGSHLHSHVGTSASASASTTSTITLASDTIRLLHDQTLSTFLDHVSSSPLSPSLSESSLSPSSSPSPLPLREKDVNANVDVNGEARRLFLHRRELGVRIQLHMLAGRRSLVSMTRFGVFPGYLEFLGDGGGGEEELVFAHQYIHIVNRIFGYLASNNNNNPSNTTNTNGLPISPNTDLHARVEVLVLIEETSRAISRLTARLGARQDVGFDRLGRRVRGMLEGVRGCLERGVDGLGNGNGNRRPEDVLHLLYCAGMVVCGCVGLPEHIGSMMPTPFESAYMDLKGFLKGFRKGVYHDMGGYGYASRMSREQEEEEEARWDAGVREVERRFREAYPGDGPGEVERGLWDALECTEDVRLRSRGGGGAVSYIPFVVFGRMGMQMPVPRIF